jgi:gamma-glutamylcyclotransferase (GGCT)/AIG2-like uncharacterized protein YtfP
VVDPELESCVVELMINSRTMFGSKPANIAGAGIFIERNQKLARDLRDRLLELRRDKLTFRVSSPESVREYLVPTVLYFAYGSNMSARQMSARLPSAQKIGTGFIEGYKLAFNRKGSYRSGGVASIVSQPQSRVYGVIWSIPKAEMARLDTIEDPLAYKPIFVEVQPEKGNSFQCHAYQAIPQGDFKPDAEYHSLVIEAAKEAGLPADYIEALEALGLSS